MNKAILPNIGDWYKDNDPRMTNRTGQIIDTVLSSQGVQKMVVKIKHSKRTFLIAPQRMFSDTKRRYTGWSLVSSLDWTPPLP